METNEQAVSTQKQIKVVFSIDENSTLIPTIAYVFDKVKKHNQGKYSNLARFSTESFVEYLLETGISAVDNAVDADIKRRNEAAYVDAMGKLQAPADATDVDAMGKYLMQCDALKRKYGIGGSQKEV